MKSYIYMTTNLINGKRYIGRKTSDVFVEDYFGSGKHLQNALNKYGKNNFKVEIIEELETKEESIEREMYWIKYYNAVQDDLFYNHSPGGLNEGWVPGENNIAKTDYCRKLNSEKHKGKKYSPEVVQKRINNQRNNNTFKIAIEKRKQTCLEKYGVDNFCKTEEFKKEQSKRTKEYNRKRDYSIVAQKNTGKKFMNKDGIQKWVNAIDVEQALKDGWKFGACKKRNRDYSNPWNKGLKMNKNI